MLQELPENHDIHHLRRALQYVRNFRVAIDGGAHKGIWTKEMLLHFEDVYSFEPEITNYEVLNDFAPDAYNIALGETEDYCSMVPGPENTGQYHCTEGDDIPVVPLDSLNIQDVDFLKLDVEGFELFALKGAKSTILEYKPAILIEENGLCEQYGVKWGEAGQYIESLGYQHIKQMNKDHLYIYAHS